MRTTLIKCHGSGNDFFIVDETTLSGPLSDKDRQEISQLICKRNHHLGGSDGVLFYIENKEVQSQMRMFNPDGSEPEMCGNGIRCHARYAYEKSGINPMKIKTQKAMLEVTKTDDMYPGIQTYETEIGPVSFSPDTISRSIKDEIFNTSIPGFFEEFAFSAISVPNPHLITMVDQVDEETVKRVGESANNNILFSEGINVSFIHKIGNNSFFVMTYERGVGLTSACGTAMSASTFIAAKMKQVRFNEYIDISNKGGRVQCKAIVTPKPMIYLKGNATYTHQYNVSIALDKQKIEVHQKHVFENEIVAYEKLRSNK